MSELPQVPAPRCKNLYCKSMMVYGEAFEEDPDYQAGLTDFWCLNSSKTIGPDDDEVNLEACSQAARACYQEY